MSGISKDRMRVAMKMLAPMEVGICCADLDRLVKFYTEIIGFSFINVGEVAPEMSKEVGLTDHGYRVARVQSPYGERLKLLQPGKAPAANDAPEPLLARRNSVYVTLIVDDLDAILRRLKDARCEFLGKPEKVEMRPGTFAVFVRDPERNVLEFVQFANVASYRSDLAAKAV